MSDVSVHSWSSVYSLIATTLIACITVGVGFGIAALFAFKQGTGTGDVYLRTASVMLGGGISLVLACQEIFLKAPS